ncbi:hypothetical protein DESC_290067 [Desulfosarcina cetonica]|uniref:Coenzyme F420 hydrogenase/dehydrogenase, beta subunit C-terminal domain n=1 Tax=Desulfosarcina cetonica TaxID=90730 RepID=UPI0006D216F9|nr:Coenzyme F420 hydrogenase/dehydrogenase, beta subunit C-terminal domain [Desulfosarcina cetonica]VTR64997.1 hypothetical protein DESC_290067 [Desulfosarcina cetonica]
MFENVSGITNDKEIGYILKSYVGYSRVKKQRESGSSGGIATWLLKSLLETGDVDACICVASSESDDRLFAYQPVDNAQTLKRTAGSRYYPVDMASILAILNARDVERRYAIIGLPCFLKGLRLAMERFPRLQRRIIYTIGLACGHLPNRFYTEYLTRLSGLNPADVVSVQYRLKTGTTRAGNYRFQAVAKSGRKGWAIPFSKINAIWQDGFFMLNACNYCDDIFAEVADIALMDAWLPEYECDPNGHSLIVVRNPDLCTVLEKGHENGTCRLKAISKDKILESQQSVIEDKRKMITGRLYRATIKSISVPTKRAIPNGQVYRKHKRRIEARFKVQYRSKMYWYLNRHRDLKAFQRKFMFTTLPFVLHRVSGRVRRVLRNPSKLMTLLRR